MEIIAIPAFTDNYIWLVHDAESGESAVVDPGDSPPVLAEAERRGWAHRPDLEHALAPGPHRRQSGDQEGDGRAHFRAGAKEHIAGRDTALVEGDEIRLGSHVGRVIEVPGHTLGHIALVFDADRVAFVGDTLFAMGCGRLFEGTPEQMYRSLQRLTELPDDTRLYCAHEYTLSNARFAAHAEPGNSAVAERLARVKSAREAGEITVPTTVAQERETNPFVRSTNVEEFARRRAAKDSFRS